MLQDERQAIIVARKSQPFSDAEQDAEPLKQERAYEPGFF
jgi:hypothetical protein